MNTLRNALGAMTVAAVLLTAGTAFAQTTGTYDPATNTYTVTGPGGTPGAPGAPGAPGTTGLPVTQGAPGNPTQGVPGNPGTTGMPSTTGAPGTTGMPTTTGTPGTPGAPNTGAGDVATTLMVLATSGVLAAAGGTYLLRRASFAN